MAFPTVSSHIRLRVEDVPPSLRDLFALYLPPENIAPWLQDRRAFEGRSPLDLLSISHELEPEAFAQGVRRIVEAFYEVLAFATVPGLPSVEEIQQAVKQRQEQVAIDLTKMVAGQRLLQDPKFGQRLLRPFRVAA